MGREYGRRRNICKTRETGSPCSVLLRVAVATIAFRARVQTARFLKRKHIENSQTTNLITSSVMAASQRGSLNEGAGTPQTTAAAVRCPRCDGDRDSLPVPRLDVRRLGEVRAHGWCSASTFWFGRRAARVAPLAKLGVRLEPDDLCDLAQTSGAARAVRPAAWTSALRRERAGIAARGARKRGAEGGGRGPWAWDGARGAGGAVAGGGIAGL